MLSWFVLRSIWYSSIKPFLSLIVVSASPCITTNATSATLYKVFKELEYIFQTESTCVIDSIDWFIQTIREAIVSDNPLTGGEKHVRGDKPAGVGIVVAGLQIVPACLLVVDIAPVTEGLICAYRICQAARCGNELAPSCRPPSGEPPAWCRYSTTVFPLLSMSLTISPCALRR